MTAIVELRQYTLHPGRRDELIALFDREFVESQEALGVQVLGQFRDLDDPNRFVWMRGFADSDARALSMTAFYGGPAWKAHRDAANATMLDSANVLQLKPLGEGFVLGARGESAGGGLVVGVLHYLDWDALPAFTEAFNGEMRPRIEVAGGHLLGAYVTEDRPNSFPALPVRMGETVLAYFLGFRDSAAYQAYGAALEDWRGAVPEMLLRQFARKPEVLRLLPTSRSRLRGA
ncbi:MAG: NIPSNAP family protein [Phenylobacterium sp.]